MRTTSENAYQLKVTLCDDPPIWRRFVIPGNFTFSDLHVVIQDAMRWNDCHLFEFEVINPVTNGKELIGLPEREDVIDDEILSAHRIRIANILSLKDVAKYTYDFGDSWVHQIEVEQELAFKKKAKYPQIVDGFGACPPEDCGGISSYKYLLDAPFDLNLQDDGENETLNRWKNQANEKRFSISDVLFRELPLKKSASVEAEHLWLRKLLQGMVTINDLKRDLGTIMPHKDIEALYDCAINKPLRYRNRAIAMLAHANEISQSVITDFLFIHIATLQNNIKLYKDKGVSSLISDKNKRKSLRKHEDPKYIEKVFSVLHSPPESFGINRTTWNYDNIQKVMCDSGMIVSKGVITKIIKNAGFKFRKAKTVLTSNDPLYQEKLKNITSILSNLGSQEKFFSIDEFGPFSVKMQGGRDLVSHGNIKIIPQWQRSKGSIIVTSALELATNQITHFFSESKNTHEMIKLLMILIEKYSEQECIYLSWDAASWHISKELQQKVDEINSEEYKAKIKSPFIKLAPLPACAQFLNVIESVYSGMARAIIHNSDYQSVDDCKTAIDKYFTERNEYFQKHPRKAGKKIWGKERVTATFSESNNCKDPKYR